MQKRLFTRPVTWVAVAVLVIGGAAGLSWFQPWRLFTDTTVTETLSSVTTPTPVTPTPATAQSTTAQSTTADQAEDADQAEGAGQGQSTDPADSAGQDLDPGPVVVRTGSFITHEHATAGTARLVRNPNGSHQVELVGLDTSDGPDLRVWLTDQAVRKGAAGWRVFDDGEWTELGRLKGNRGDQIYPIPAGVDPADYRSVSIWCKRFAVSFGAAALR